MYIVRGGRYGPMTTAQYDVRIDNKKYNYGWDSVNNELSNTSRNKTSTKGYNNTIITIYLMTTNY